MELQYITVNSGETVNVRESGAGTPVKFTLWRGTPVGVTNLGGAYSRHITVWEPAKRYGYVDMAYLSATEPSNSVPWEQQLFGKGILQKGSTGAFVKNLQGYLKVDGSGANLAMDGDFGNATYNAVVAYQKKKGLTADGIVGDKTKDKLMSIERLPNDFFK